MQIIRLPVFLLSLALALPVVALEPSTGSDRKQPMQALSQAIVDLKNGDRYLLRAQPVRKTIAGTPVRLYAYNGSVPGPLLRVRQGSTVTIELVNALDRETAIDWGGVRVDKTQDGARKAIPPSGRQRYVLQFPQPGLYCYHSQTDSQQDVGLYGNIQVLPRDSKAYGPVDREEMLVLGALTLSSQARRNSVAPKTQQPGRIPLLNGEERYQLKVRTGERIRFYLTNAASARPFNLALPSIGLQRVDGSSSRRARAESVESIRLAPGDRAIVEAVFPAPGSIPVIDDAADRAYELGRIEVVLATERHSAGQESSTPSAPEPGIQKQDGTRPRRPFW